MRNLQLLLLFVSLLWPRLSLADNRLVLTLKRPPQALFDQALAQLPAARAGGRVVSRRSLGLGDLAAIYAGYFDIADPDGLISFPLRHTKPLVYVLITPRLHLVKVKGQTVSHREIVPAFRAKTKLYEYTLETAPSTEGMQPVSFWRIKEITSLPADNKINPLTVVLLTDPANVYVPNMEIPVQKEPHFVLPSIYVVGGGMEADLCTNIELMRYFEPIGTMAKKASDQMVQRQVANP